MARSLLTRRQFISAATLAMVAPSGANASDSALYQARTIVTGTRAETRLPGLLRCLAQVLVRVSGNARLSTHPALAGLKAETAVRGWTYRDLYAFRPIRDEQGTRDRPYEMTVAYDPAAIDALLGELGSGPWRGDRPRLVVFLGVRHIGTSFMLTSMSDAGDLMRESFKDAAWGAALEVVIPSEMTVTAAGLTVESIEGVDPSSLLTIVDRNTGQQPLVGMLAWSRELLGWKAHWRLAHGGGTHAWKIEGVNFDAAFRSAVGGAALILSGKGEAG